MCDTFRKISENSFSMNIRDCKPDIVCLHCKQILPEVSISFAGGWHVFAKPRKDRRREIDAGRRRTGYQLKWTITSIIGSPGRKSACR